MNPILFDSSATSFETNGVGVLLDVVSCNVVEELNGKFELNMTMLSSDKYFDKIEIGMIIVAQPNLTDSRQAFVIENITKNIDGEIEIYATHIAQHRTKLIPVDNYTSTSLADSLIKIKSKSKENNPFNLFTNKTSSAVQNFNFPLTMRECLGGYRGSLLDVYGGEYRWNNFDISLLDRRGQDTNIRILYGLNMVELNVDDEFDFDASITGILPFWFSDEQGLVEGTIQYTSNANQFPYKKTIPVDFSNEFETKPTVSQLNSLAQSFLANRGLPTRNLKVAFEQIQQFSTGDNIKVSQNLSLGDTVSIIYSDYNINYQSRIVEIDFDVLLERYNSMEIGDKKTTINEAITSLVESDVDDFTYVASDIKYSNALSGLQSTNVQNAIDELDEKIDKIGYTYSKGFTSLSLPNDSYTKAIELTNLPKGTYIVVSVFNFPTGATGVRRSITYANSSSVPTFSRYNGETENASTIGTTILQYTRVLTLNEDVNTLGLAGYHNNGGAIANCSGMLYATRIA